MAVTEFRRMYILVCFLRVKKKVRFSEVPSYDGQMKRRQMSSAYKSWDGEYGMVQSMWLDGDIIPLCMF